MKKALLFIILFSICLFWLKSVIADGFPVVVSVNEYKINPKKYDEISDPDVYFEIIYNESVIETSKTVRDSNFHSYGEMKAFGDYCQGIRGLESGDKITMKFYDSDFDTGIAKRFWEWVQGSLYKNFVYFDKQVKLMNDPNKKYDDYDAYKTATEDSRLKQAEDELTNNIMKIKDRRDNRQVYEYMGDVVVDVGSVLKEFQSGKIQYASAFKIVDARTSKVIGKVNLVITLFEGYGASLKVKGY